MDIDLELRVNYAYCYNNRGLTGLPLISEPCNRSRALSAARRSY
jgi:hypothetical protein